jgi:hypothetical protein
VGRGGPEFRGAERARRAQDGRPSDWHNRFNRQTRMEEWTLARSRALRSDLIDPTIAVHHGCVTNSASIRLSTRARLTSKEGVRAMTRGMIE